MGGAGSQGVLGLVSARWWVRLVPRLVQAHWWVDLCPAVSSYSVLGFLGLVLAHWCVEPGPGPSVGYDHISGCL